MSGILITLSKIDILIYPWELIIANPRVTFKTGSQPVCRQTLLNKYKLKFLPTHGVGYIVQISSGK